MLKVDNLGFCYKKDNWLFRHINLICQRGEVIGIYGDSGIGKSTFAKLITGYLQPTEGEINVPHKLNNKSNPVQLIWQHPERTINPKWKLSKIFVEASDLDSEIMQWMDINDEWLNHYPGELSGGELQRFCIARSLGKHTRFIIADEITSMFDTVTQAQIWNMLLNITEERGIGMVVISHNVELLNRISHHLIDFNEFSN